MRSYIGFCLAMALLTACGEPNSSTPNPTPDVGTDATNIDTGLPGDTAATTDVAEQTDILPDTDTVPGTDALTGDAATDADNTDATGSDTTQPTCSSDGDCQTSAPCTVALCLAQACKVLAAPVGTPCDDANACTTGEKCAGTTCQAGTAVVCNDGDPCTTDACDLASGCTKVASSGETCNDGDTCTTSDTCANGSCVGTALNCDDGNVCTTDFCVGGTCQHGDTTDGTACGDGDPCKVSGCDNGDCVAKPKLWSTPLAVDANPMQLIAMSFGLIVADFKYPYYKLTWYDILGKKIKEEASKSVHMAKTPAGNLVHAQYGSVAMTDKWGAELWSTAVPEIADELGVGQPKYTKIYAGSDGCYAVGDVTTGKYLRAAVARFSYTGAFEWQFASPPESGGWYPDGAVLSDDGFMFSTSTKFFIPGSYASFLRRFSKSGKIEAGPTYVPLLYGATLAPLGGLSAVAIRSNSLHKVSAALQVTDLSQGGFEAQFEQSKDGLRIMGFSYFLKVNNDGHIEEHTLNGVSGAKLFSYDDNAIYVAAKLQNLSWHLHRIDRYGNTSCGTCMQNLSDCNDNQTCTLDGCSNLNGCVTKENNCNDGNQCTLDSCSETIGCIHTPANDGVLCSDNDSCTVSDQCTDGQCTTLPACSPKACEAYACLQGVNPTCLYLPKPAGVSCMEGGRCSANQNCETEFCEFSVVVPAVPSIAAGQTVELPFDVSLTSAVKWVRLHASGSDPTTIYLKFNGQEYGYRPNPGQGLLSGSYFSNDCPMGIYGQTTNVNSYKFVPAGLVPTGQWQLRVQGGKDLKDTGFLDPTTVTFGYQCPAP